VTGSLHQPLPHLLLEGFVGDRGAGAGVQARAGGAVWMFLPDLIQSALLCTCEESCSIGMTHDAGLILFTKE